MSDNTEALAAAAFKADWPKDDFSRFGPNDYVRDRYRRIAAAVVAALSVEGKQPVADGWLYQCDDGTEWSEQHPIESGEMPDATDVRPGTATNLRIQLIGAWKALAEAQSRLAAPPSLEAVKAESYRRGLEDAAKVAADEDGHFSCWGEDRNTVVAQETCAQAARAIRALIPSEKEGHPTDLCQKCGKPREFRAICGPFCGAIPSEKEG